MQIIQIFQDIFNRNKNNETDNNLCIQKKKLWKINVSLLNDLQIIKIYNIKQSNI